jgi:hypothetical protein
LEGADGKFVGAVESGPVSAGEPESSAGVVTFEGLDMSKIPVKAGLSSDAIGESPVRSVKTGKYVTTGSGKGSGPAGVWGPSSEKFGVVVRGRKAVLQSKKSGKFLSTQPDGKTLAATGESVESGSPLSVAKVRGGYTLEAAKGKYVSVGAKGAIGLSSKPEVVVFTELDASKLPSPEVSSGAVGVAKVRSVEHGSYVGSEAGGASDWGSTADPMAVVVRDGKVALQSTGNGRYVTRQANGSLGATADSVGKPELFEVARSGEGFTLEGADGKFVGAAESGGVSGTEPEGSAGVVTFEGLDMSKVPVKAGLSGDAVGVSPVRSVKTGKYVTTDSGSGSAGVWGPSAEKFGVVVRGRKAVLQSKGNGKFVTVQPDGTKLAATGESAESGSAFSVAKVRGGYTLEAAKGKYVSVGAKGAVGLSGKPEVVVFTELDESKLPVPEVSCVAVGVAMVRSVEHG